MRPRSLPTLALLAAVAAALPGAPARAADAVEIVRYDRAPVAVTLPVGRERLITFPTPVQFGMPPGLAEKLRVQTVGDTLYLRPGAPFAAARVAVRSLDDGRIFLFDLVASHDAGETSQLRILPVAAAPEPAPQPPAAAGQATPPPPSHGYVTLTRFALRQVYAPERLAAGLAGVAPVPLPALPWSTALLRGGGIEARPLASWRSMNGLYVTAIELRNRLAEPVAWDPRLVRGQWRAVAAVHPDLGARGGASDTAAIAVIHDRPFAAAAAPWLD
jgi:integrating conjugative element protein (TIGR03749 family)